jgi:hypothetical protein
MGVPSSGMAMSIVAVSVEGIEIQCGLAILLVLGLEGVLFPEKVQKFNFRVYSKLTPWNPYLDRMKSPEYRRAMRIMGCLMVFVFLLAEFVVIRFPNK